MEKFEVGDHAKVGDVVQIECDSGLRTGGPEKVTKISTEIVGGKQTGMIILKPVRRKVIWCGKHAFAAHNGEALNPPYPPR